MQNINERRKELNKTRTVRILRIIMPIVAIVSILVFAPINAAIAWITPLPDTVQAELQNSVNRGFDGVIVYTDVPNQQPQRYATGWNNRADEIPADPESLFRIASISKLYIATATTKLVNDGMLSLDDTVANHLPDMVGQIKNVEDITVRMLVQHRSGIFNFVNDPDYT